MYARRLLFGLALLCLCAGSARADNTRIVMRTDLGDIELELYDDTNPITVANFVAYQTANFYDQLMINRSIPNFVIQAGGFRLLGSTITPVPTNPPIQNEVLHSNLRGTIAMALSGSPADPNSGTSQWFINVADNTGLDPDFTVFGQVVNGMSVVDAINALPAVNLGLGAAFTNVPVENWTPGNPVLAENLVLVNDTSFLPAMPIVPWPSVAIGSVGLLGLALGYRRRRAA